MAALAESLPKHLDAETLDVLEELLITADMGVKTAAEVVKESFAKIRQDKEISDQLRKPSTNYRKFLQLCEQNLNLTAAKKPFVIFNG